MSRIVTLFHDLAGHRQQPIGAGIPWDFAVYAINTEDARLTDEILEFVKAGK